MMKYNPNRAYNTAAACQCGAPAQHRVSEIIPADERNSGRAPLAAYVCRFHFAQIMGSAAFDALMARNHPLHPTPPKEEAVTRRKGEHDIALRSLVPDAPLAVNILRAARLLGVGRSTIYRLIKQGRLPIVKIGKRTLIERRAIVSLIERIEN
jgi:excisionase family DNA binding protein